MNNVGFWRDIGHHQKGNNLNLVELNSLIIVSVYFSYIQLIRAFSRNKEIHRFYFALLSNWSVYIYKLKYLLQSVVLVREPAQTQQICLSCISHE